MNMYDIRNGIRVGDREALSFEYDPRPLIAGEMGAGTLVDTPDTMLNDADRQHLAAINAFRTRKGWPLIAESEYREHVGY